MPVGIFLFQAEKTCFVVIGYDEGPAQIRVFSGQFKITGRSDQFRFDILVAEAELESDEILLRQSFFRQPIDFRLRPLIEIPDDFQQDRHRLPHGPGHAQFGIIQTIVMRL